MTDARAGGGVCPELYCPGYWLFPPLPPRVHPVVHAMSLDPYDPTDLLSTPEHASARNIYHAAAIDPGAAGIRECEHPECQHDSGLAFITRLEGDVAVYCPTHRDRNWGMKIR